MRRPSRSTAVLLLLAAYLSVLSVHLVIDDYWVNVAVGREIVETGRIPHSDVFSYAESDREWLPHMWLSRVFMAVVDDVGGLQGTRLVFLVLTFGFLLAVWAFYRAVGLPAWGVALGLCLVFALSLDRFRYRPTIFTMTFLYAGLAFLAAYWPNLSRWRVLALYPFTALWVNLHSGGLIFPLVVCGAAGADVASAIWVRRMPKQMGLRLAAAAATVLGSLTTPYTYRLWVYIFEPKPLLEAVPEYFSPLSFFLQADRWDMIPMARVPFVLVPWLVVLVIAAPIAWHLGRCLWRAVTRQVGPGETMRDLWQLPNSAPMTLSRLGASLPLIYLTVRHVRFLYMTGIPVGLLLARYRTNIAERGIAYGIVVAATVGLLGYVSMTNGNNVISVLQRPSAHTYPDRLPLASTEYLKERKAEGRIFCYNVQWAGYLLYHLYPECRTFYDTRHTYGGARIPDEARAIRSGSPRQGDLLRHYDVNIIVAKGEFHFAPGEARRWKLVHTTKKPPFDVVYVLKDPPP